MKKRVVFRVDGYPELGLGHITRCLSLAERLKEKNIIPIFLIKNYPEPVKEILNNGYNLKVIPRKLNEKEEINLVLKTLKSLEPKVIITDMPYVSDDYLKALKNTMSLLASIDDLGSKNFSSDMVIAGYLSSRLKTYNLSPRSKLYLGVRYLILRKEFETAHRTKRKIKEKANKVLVALGGADWENLTLKVAQALNDIKKELEITIVQGSLYQHREKLKTFLIKSKQDFLVKLNVRNMAELMLSSDIAFTAGGETSYELAATGTPSINISQQQHQVINAEEEAKKGFSVNLGLGKQVSKKKILETVENLLEDYELRQAMSRKGKQLIDAKGAGRVAEIILNSIKNGQG